MANGKDVGYEGTPALPDLFTYASPDIRLRDDMVPTPDGMNTATNTARINKSQNQSETKLVGVPGTTYDPNEGDEIIRSVGGHVLVMGNSPGNETLRVQSAHGTIIEMSADGSLRITSPSHVHIGAAGDLHFVPQGDIHFATSGNFHLKAGNVYLDTHDLIHTVSGAHVQDITGDHCQRITGDSHTSVQGDHSRMVGGDDRETIAGNQKSQVYADRRIHTGGQHEQSSTGNMRMETKGELHSESDGNMKQGTLAKHIVEAADDTSHTTLGNHTTSVKKDLTHNVNGNIQHVADGTITHQSQGDMTHSTSASMTENAGADHTINAGDSHTTNAIQKITHTSPTNITTAQQGQSTSHPITPATFSMPSSPSAPGQAADTNVNVAKANPQTPDDVTIHHLVGDATDTSYIWSDIPNEQTVYNVYAEEGGQPPGDVLAKMKAKGMDYDLYAKNQQTDMSNSSDTDSPTYDVNHSSWVNPFG